MGREIGERGGMYYEVKYYTDLRQFCTRRPATTAIVVGREAAHTPSFFNVFSSIPDATTNGGTH